MTRNKVKQACCAHGDTICPRPSPTVGAQAPRATPRRRNVAVLSHAEYVPTLTDAVALRVKAALSKAAWWPWPFDLESGVRVTCHVGYLFADFGLPIASLFSSYARWTRQTDVRQKHHLMPSPIRGGGIIIWQGVFQYTGSLWYILSLVSVQICHDVFLP